MVTSHNHRVTLTDIIAEHGSENKYHTWGKAVNKNNICLFIIARLYKTMRLATYLLFSQVSPKQYLHLKSGQLTYVYKVYFLKLKYSWFTILLVSGVKGLFLKSPGHTRELECLMPRSEEIPL